MYWCRYREKTKRNCSRVVLCLSIILFVLGINVAGIGYYVLRGGQEPISSSYSEFTPDFTGENLALISGLLCVVVAILGCFATKCRTNFLTIPFQILSILICILMLACASLTSGYFNEFYQSFVDDQFYQACDTPIEGSDITTGQKIE